MRGRFRRGPRKTGSGGGDQFKPRIMGKGEATSSILVFGKLQAEKWDANRIEPTRGVPTQPHKKQKTKPTTHTNLKDTRGKRPGERRTTSKNRRGKSRREGEGGKKKGTYHNEKKVTLL